MRLIGRYASPFVRRVAVTMQIYGLPYDHLSVMPFGDDQAALSRLNPIRRVPVLQLDNGECLIDSAAIIDHLDTLADPGKILTPTTGPERRRVLTLLAVATGAMDKLVAVLYERHFRSEEKQHEPWISRCEAQVISGFNALDREFARPWATGSKMTQADVTLAVFWLFGRAKRPDFFGRLDCPNIKKMSAALAITPAFEATEAETEILSTKLSSGK